MSKFAVRKSSDGQFYWVLIADNGEVEATSEMYSREADAARGAAAAQANAAAANPGNE